MQPKDNFHFCCTGWYRAGWLTVPAPRVLVFYGKRPSQSGPCTPLVPNNSSLCSSWTNSMCYSTRLLGRMLCWWEQLVKSCNHLRFLERGSDWQVSLHVSVCFPWAVVTDWLWRQDAGFGVHLVWTSIAKCSSILFTIYLLPLWAFFCVFKGEEERCSVINSLGNIRKFLEYSHLYVTLCWVNIFLCGRLNVKPLGIAKPGGTVKKMYNVELLAMLEWSSSLHRA